MEIIYIFFVMEFVLRMSICLKGYLQERLHARTKSLWNEREVNLILQTINRLFELGVKGDDIGVIALCKDIVY
jgi:hypothetical protein